MFDLRAEISAITCPTLVTLRGSGRDDPLTLFAVHGPVHSGRQPGDCPGSRSYGRPGTTKSYRRTLTGISELDLGPDPRPPPDTLSSIGLYTIPTNNQCRIPECYTAFSPKLPATRQANTLNQPFVLPKRETRKVHQPASKACRTGNAARTARARWLRVFFSPSDSSASVSGFFWQIKNGVIAKAKVAPRSSGMISPGQIPS